MSLSALKIRGAHGALGIALAPGKRRFEQGLGHLEQVQRAKLAQLLPAVARVRGGRLASAADWQWEDFSSRLPVTGWNDWLLLAAEQQRTRTPLLVDSPVVRYQPTSGSTSAIKQIPYTRRFLGELDAAIAPWLGDLYRRFPAIRQGRHYWSVSWLPTALREQFQGDLNDDTQLLATGKRVLAALTQSVPQATSLVETSDGSLFATVAYLVADGDLGMLSIWSPTFGLGLLERIATWREQLAVVLDSGQWPGHFGKTDGLPCPRSPRAAALLRSWNGGPDPEFFRLLWPKLALVSAWDTAAAAPWADALRARLPHASFQGKGLWATEGVVTIPFMDQHVLAYQSHVYEFEDAQDGRILPPWALQPGQQVIPLITTGSGLLRYRMNDVLAVDGVLGSVPSLRFLGRNDGTDLVGEKISTTLAQQMLDALASRYPIRPVTVLAAADSVAGKPGYLLLAEPTATLGADTAAALVEDFETGLLAHFHYRLARDLGQLTAARMVLSTDMQGVYVGLRQAAGMIEGNVKIEALTSWRRPLPDLLQSAGHERVVLRAGGVSA